MVSMELRLVDKAGRFLLFRFDAFLRRSSGVFTFCDEAACLLRLQLRGAPHEIILPDCMIQKGEPVLALHLWNEHLPHIPPGGPTLAWAVGFQRLLVRSFQAVAGRIDADPRFAGIRAVGGVLALLPLDENAGGVRLMRRLGFTVFPYHHRFGRFGEFWENFYSWWLLWAYNPASLRSRQLFHLYRSEIWMSTGKFLDYYKKGGKSR